MNYIKSDCEYRIINDYKYLINKGYELIIILTNNNKTYYLDGLLHRENAPAIIHSNGYQAWFQHEKYHRLNGAAIEYSSGVDNTQSYNYFIKNSCYSYQGYWETIFANKKHIKELNKFCPICNQFIGNDKEIMAVHLDQDMENNKLTPDLQNNSIFQQRFDLIIKKIY